MSRNKRWFYPEAARAWVRERIKNEGLRVGDRQRWFKEMRRLHPEWMKGPGRKPASEGGFAHMVLREAVALGIPRGETRKPTAPLNGRHVHSMVVPVIPKAVVDAAEEQMAKSRGLATALISRVVGMAQRPEKQPTLVALEELTRDEG